MHTLSHPHRLAAWQAGRDRRRLVRRSAQAAFSPGPGRADPVAVLRAQGTSRIQHLLPLRWQRMRADPFAFFRGAAAVMAADLATTPNAGIRQQSSGDCHLANFGAYASPEGLPVFDLNDFDETLEAPFEWDIKRLAASVTIAGEVAGLSERRAARLAVRAARAYADHIAWLAALPPLEAWSTHIDLAAAIAGIDDAKLRSRVQHHLGLTLASGEDHFGLIEQSDDAHRIVDKPPTTTRLDDADADAVRGAFADYTATLTPERRHLLGAYRLRDVAMKVVGVGSVGTFCAIGLFVADGNAPLMLQLKEAQASVLAPFAGASPYANQGERVVAGQRMLQAAIDVFLGWAPRPVAGRDVYIRRLKDSRLASVGEMTEASLPFRAALCGHTLARAHARAGNAATIAGYLGRGRSFARAIGEFALAYAGQNRADFARFCEAFDKGVLF